MTLRIALAALIIAAGQAAAAPDLKPLADGDMKKLAIHEEPKAVSEAEFETAEDGSGTLADYRGKYVLVNFWATWCAPCRKEMPQLQALQDAYGGDGFEVVTIATGRNAPEKIEEFFAEAGVHSLPRHRDPKQALARDMAVLGLPITVLIDPEGREIARLIGDADWNSDSAHRIVEALLAAES